MKEEISKPYSIVNWNDQHMIEKKRPENGKRWNVWMSNSSLSSQPSRTPEDRLCHQRGPTLQVVSDIKVGGVAGQSPILHQSNPIMGPVHLLPARRINWSFSKEDRGVRPCSRCQQARTKVNRKRICRITADSRSSPLMHLILPSPRAYWNMNFPRNSWFWLWITTHIRVIVFSTSASIGTKWWSSPETIQYFNRGDDREKRKQQRGGPSIDF